MERFDIISTIGAKYHVGNIENGEFSYAKALKTVGKDIKDYQKQLREQNTRTLTCDSRMNVLRY